MNERTLPCVHRHTADLVSVDSRHLELRQVAYLRSTAQEPAQRQITLNLHGLGSQWRRTWDPRRFEELQQNDSSAPSQGRLASLSGQPLFNESGDAGWQLLLPGEAGQVMERWDSRDSHWQAAYDELLRPLSLREQAAGQAPRVAERFTYAGEDHLNRRGRLLRHDDAAGSRLIDGYSLGGAEQGETRHFLASLDLPDWPAATADRDALLEPGAGASSRVAHGPLLDVLEQTDAQGNRQRLRFTADGALRSLFLLMADASEYPLLRDTRYNAFARIETQTAGNGVVSHCEYDPANGRLLRLYSSRPGRTLLQDLHYRYDPVGNVSSIEDRSQPVTHFANQRVDPLDTFRYDSLYRLVEASGREAVGASGGPQLPELAPDPGDTSRLLNYREHYRYDASGNLLSLSHVGQHSWTRSFDVAEHSNRAVPAPGDPLTAFDANGNLLHLGPGLPLHWNARNQLHGCRQVLREGGEDDAEHYRYDGNGLRARKVVSRQVAGRTQHSETRYLPGLELHSRTGQAFAVILARAGRCTVRCLHWSLGRPAGVDDPQLRYSLDDLHGSSTLELDAEARIISHEGWYPFGGTAWWAARSALEASYKVRRYCGKERDASGLYAYGLRYYAPWLARWISPDPAGDVDGLNRYQFVGNNPLSHVDPLGLNKVELGSFPPSVRVPPSRVVQQAAGHDPAASLQLAGDGQVHDFAYDLIWTSRELLPLGAGNQVASAYGSKLRSTDRVIALQIQDLENSLNDIERAEHAIAAEAGNCGNYSTIVAALAASAERWPGIPVYRVGLQNVDHVFSMLGDARVMDPLVLDAWVLYPVVHPLSASKYAAHQEQFQQSDWTPRMPGDPRFAMSWDGVNAKVEHYPERDAGIDYPSLEEMQLLEKSFWHQVTAMDPSRSVIFNDGLNSNGAYLPRHQAAQLEQNLWLANHFLARYPGFAPNRI